MTSSKPRFNYGGQAVIEGVMMRGAHLAAIAVRDPQGNIVIHEEPLNSTIYQGRISKIPFLRGLIGLWDALVLGTRALIWSANIALIEEEEEATTESTEEKKSWFSRLPFVGKILHAFSISQRILTIGIELAFTENTTQKSRADHDNAFSDVTVVGLVIVSLSLGVGLFMVLPAAASDFAGTLLGTENRLIKDTIEALIKLGLFIGYIAAIGQMEDVKRLFGYHGAEHKTINAYEAGAPLVPEEVQKHSIEHPRCGTAFLLTVVFVSILAHAITGRPSNFFLLLLSRIAAVPIVAGLAYEIIKFTAKHIENPIIKLIIIPNLLLQRLTTRQPDNSMVEVAIHALQRVIHAEEVVARGEALLTQNELIINTNEAQ
ncbi:MAG: DUF1385 domain-containing protein [Phototrophicales bacterium]|nr:MAG: DUF1385 domain-containing protein [Phototrophicales bacterium]